MSDRHRTELLLAFGIALGIFVAYQVRHVLLLIYVSALFAVVFGPVIELVRRVRMGSWNPSRGFAVLIIVALAFAAAILVLTFLVPPIIRDVEGLAADWPHRAVSLFERLSKLPIAGKLEAGRLEQYLSGTAGGVFSLLKGIAGGLVGFFSWLVLTAYFILDGDRAFHWAISLFPSHHRFRLESLKNLKSASFCSRRGASGCSQRAPVDPSEWEFSPGTVLTSRFGYLQSRFQKYRQSRQMRATRRRREPRRVSGQIYLSWFAVRSNNWSLPVNAIGQCCGNL
jgi:hypothetical protein